MNSIHNLYSTNLYAMEISLIINILLMIGASQGFLLSIALAGVKRGNKTANRILAVLLFLFSLIIFFHTLHEFQSTPEPPPHEMRGSEIIFFLFGPLFYLYCIALTGTVFRLSKKHLIHALPFILVIVIVPLVKITFGKDLSEMIISRIRFLIPWLLFIQLSIYFYKMIVVLKEHKAKIKEVFSTIDKINLDWLQFLIIGQAIIWPVSFLGEIIGGDSETWNYVYLLISIFIYLMGYKGFRQPEIFSGLLLEVDTADKIVKKKYEKSTLTPELAEQYFNRLTKLMEEEKPYIESNITLPALSKRLKISTHHLSQVINEKLSLNFFEYVNNFRIESAKAMLKNPEYNNLTVAAIGFESGFNSVSSFNSVFKKITGKTPTQYKSGA